MIPFDEHTEERYSVSELTAAIKDILETSLPTLWVEGEISNFTHHSSGHMYFSIKDANAQISCVMWSRRNTTLRFYPQAGMRVFVLANVRVYEKRGTYQLDCLRMMPAGTGDLQVAFEQLKLKLFNEGLFDEELKKPIPALPERIGIVTSPTGAALQDMLNVLRRRLPFAQPILRPALVQGDEAARDIADAIREFDRAGNVDVMIIGRGGGSMEDLWAFNEQVVVRAIHECKIPVISAVGHEIDYTLIDFAADLRAPTPSAAMELAVPYRGELAAQLQELERRCFQAAKSEMNAKRTLLNSTLDQYVFRQPLDKIAQNRQYIDEILRYCSVNINSYIRSQKQHLFDLHKQIDSMHPRAVLKRGYSIVRHNKDIVLSSSSVEPDDAIDIEFNDGYVDARVESRQT